MKTPTAALLLMTLAACHPKSPAPPDSGPPEAPVGEPAGAGAPTSGSLHGAAATFGVLAPLGALALVLATDELSDDLGPAPGPGGPAAPPEPSCAAEVSASGSTYTLDFSGCEDGTTTGVVTVTVDGHPASSLTVSFDEDFSHDGVSLSGSVGLSQGQGGWMITVSALTVHDDTRSVSLAMDLNSTLDASALSLWGDGTALVDDQGEVSVEAYLGGVDADSALSATDPLRWSAGSQCVCPDDGTLGLAMTYIVSSVEVDLDDYVDASDGADDYAPMDVALAEPVEVSLSAVTTFGETCGEIEQSVSAEATTFTLSWERLAEASCTQTCGGTWDSAALTCTGGEEACSELADRVASLAGTDAADPSITLSAEELTALATEALESQVNGEMCAPGGDAGLTSG